MGHGKKLNRNLKEANKRVMPICSLFSQVIQSSGPKFLLSKRLPDFVTAQSLWYTHCLSTIDASYTNQTFSLNQQR